MSRKLRFFHDQVAKAGKLAYRPIMENVTNLDELDHKLGDLESELLEINANNDKLQSSQSELTELKLVLQNVSFTLPFCALTIIWYSLSLSFFSFFFFFGLSLVFFYWFGCTNAGQFFSLFFPFGLTNVVVKDSAVSMDENLCVYLVSAHLWSSPKFYNFLLFVFVGVFCFEREPHFSTPQGMLKMANNCSQC